MNEIFIDAKKISDEKLEGRTAIYQTRSGYDQTFNLFLNFLIVFIELLQKK
jgi:hypothetical protein